MARYFFWAFAIMFFVFTASSWGQTVVNVNCPGQSLQAAINAAGINTEIDITGNCNENILIDNDKIKVFLIGQQANRGATINGNGSTTTLDVRGKAIFISNLTIGGGTNGIHVQRGSNAVINNNLVQNNSSRGIIVSDLAFAVITGDTIQNNTSDGILINTNSTAHIGFNSTSDAQSSPNTIQANGGRGINVIRTSSARIYGNMIQNNGSDGIGVFRLSHADIATNTINGNGTAFVAGGTDGNGVSVAQNSSVQLGEDQPAPLPGGFADQPNTTTVNNANNGIRCVSGGSVRGHMGPGTPGNQQLTGAVSQFGGGAGNTLSNSCQNSLTVP